MFIINKAYKLYSHQVCFKTHALTKGHCDTDHDRFNHLCTALNSLIFEKEFTALLHLTLSEVSHITVCITHYCIRWLETFIMYTTNSNRTLIILILYSMHLIVYRLKLIKSVHGFKAVKLKEVVGWYNDK